MPSKKLGHITCGQNLDVKELKSRKSETGSKIAQRARPAHGHGLDDDGASAIVKARSDVTKGCGKARVSLYFSPVIWRVACPTPEPRFAERNSSARLKAVYALRKNGNRPLPRPGFSAARFKRALQERTRSEVKSRAKLELARGVEGVRNHSRRTAPGTDARHAWISELRRVAQVVGGDVEAKRFRLGQLKRLVNGHIQLARSPGANMIKESWGISRNQVIGAAAVFRSGFRETVIVDPQRDSGRR